MAKDNRHKGWLLFVRRVVDVPLGYSKDDLLAFRSLAARQYPALVPLLNDYITLAEDSDTNSQPKISAGARPKKQNSADKMHLFDLLREKRLFASNSELSNFAARILPGMKTRRFDNMSKGDIAARIIEYLETLDKSARKKLEDSMRDALDSPPIKDSYRRSFLSKWERIIKGIEL